ncbi:Ribonuclease H-like superfamily, partial [Sesbania bispinosa]
MRPPSSAKETQQLLGKLGYIRRFIPALGELISPLRGLLKEKAPFEWGKAQQESFEQIKQIITSPQVMSPPVAQRPLRLYIAVTDHSKYRHYFQAHTIEIMIKSEGIKYMLQNPSPTGRVSKWALMLSEYDLRVVHPQRLRSQALADMLAISYKGGEVDAMEEFNGELSELISTFDEVEATHVPRAENRYADALATIGSKETRDAAEEIVIFRKIEQSSLAMVSYQGRPNDWRSAIIEQLKQKICSKVARDYQEMYGELYKKALDGLLMKCVPEDEGVLKMENLHHAICGDPGAQFVEEDAAYWRTQLKKFFDLGELPIEPREAEKLKKKAERYFYKEGELFKNSFTGDILRCVGREEGEVIMRETRQGVCGRHQGGRSLWAEILRLGQGNLIHALAVSMGGIMSPYPFHTWVMDFIGPISPHSRGNRWIPVATKHYKRWVEAIATKEAKAEVVTSFIKENIVCRFGLPRRIVSDNGTHFVNSKVRRILEKYRIRHDKSSPYYPQSNGQEESSNKNLIRILGRMVKDAPKEWADYLQLALWAYRTTKHGSKKATPFSLVYGAKAVVPVEILTPSARMMIGENAPRESVAEIIEEVREKAEDELLKHHRRLTLAYEKLVRPRMFCEGELVLKATDAVMRKQHTSKWVPNWEGPYIVKEARYNGCCTLVDPEDQREIGPINF